jgi:hypothetical protein
MKKSLFLVATFLTAGLSAFATTIAPSGNPLALLPGATFSGTGIPNTEVEISTTSGGDVITLGLTATQRYFNPALANDGKGTFFANTGLNNGLGATPHSLGSTWNFDYYINVNNLSGANYTFQLVYANNTTGVSDFVTLGINKGSTTIQDSQNLTFTPYSTDLSFDPLASGVYGFELVVLDARGGQVASTAINVNVSSVPDSGSTALLLGLGFVGLVGFGYRRSLAFAK